MLEIHLGTAEKPEQTILKPASINQVHLFFPCYISRFPGYGVHESVCGITHDQACMDFHILRHSGKYSHFFAQPQGKGHESDKAGAQADGMGVVYDRGCGDVGVVAAEVSFFRRVDKD